MDNQKTFMSLCTGAAGADVGAQLAGYKPINGVEINADIASVAHMNGFDCIVDDIRHVDYTQLEQPDWLHSSTPCINASTANQKKGETELDKELALAVCRAIIALKPSNFSLENVRGYVTFKAYQIIKQCLLDNGYTYIDGILNAADYGTPQARKRLFLVASKTAIPKLPYPTHDAQANLFLHSWVGWRDSIIDLVSTFACASFAPWQIKRMPNELMQTLLDGTCVDSYIIDNKTGQSGMKVTYRRGDKPMYTIVSYARSTPVAYIDGKTYKLSTRALARFNGLPDTYILPNKQSLACWVLGNMVMPLVMKAIIEVNNG